MMARMNMAGRTKHLSRDPMWRDIVRRRAVGETVEKIAEDIGKSRGWVYTVLNRPECKTHLAKLLDDMDAELVRAMVYAPYAILLAGGKRRRSPVMSPRSK